MINCKLVITYKDNNIINRNILNYEGERASRELCLALSHVLNKKRNNHIIYTKIIDDYITTNGLKININFKVGFDVIKYAYLFTGEELEKYYN